MPPIVEAITTSMILVEHVNTSQKLHPNMEYEQTILLT